MQISKYSASGNDFVIFHTFKKRDLTKLAIKLCDRQNGVGADGLIALVPHSKYDFEWQFYNSDGSEANMCGNGSRAAAHYAFANSLADNSMSFLTLAGVIKADVQNSMVQSDLTPPTILKENIEEFDKNWLLIDTGVPHLISFVENIDEFNINEARELRQKYNANVNIAYINSDESIRVRTYERGVENETQACGTGMASAFYRAVKENLIGLKNTKVYPTSKETLYLGLENETITFKGEVKKVFETTIDVI